MMEIEVIASRNCSNCGQTVEESLNVVQDISKNTTPWIMFYTLLFELPLLDCCSSKFLPTHIQVKSHSPIDDGLFSGKNKFKIGSEEVPIITDKPESYAVTRSYKEQIELEQQLAKQKKLWERQKDDFFHKTYTYFSVHFEQIIDEMDHQEVLDILRTFEDGYMQISTHRPRKFVYKGKNERKLITKWIKKEIKSLAQEESEEVKKYLFFLIVDYFVQLKLIPQIHYLKWDPQKFEKMIGESLLMYLLVTFPLTSYFSFLKDEAILRLTNKGHFQKELRQLLEKSQKELATVSSNNAKMQLIIESQREAIADLEAKNERLQLQTSRLQKKLNETGEKPLLERQSNKIRELKGLINELQKEVKELRSRQIVVSKIEMAQVDDVKTDLVTIKEPEKDFTVLGGKTIGIFGNIQGYESDDEQFQCKILSCESMKSANAVGILKESDILVVLIQHISHSCMWSIKEYANVNDIPIIYSRHTNIEIILEQVVDMLS